MSMQEMQRESFLTAYVQSVLQRLYGEGYQCAEHVVYGGQTFAAVGYKGGFEISKFGYFESFFVLQHLAAIDPYSLRNFSAHCFNYAKAARRFSLPLGFFAAMVCYPVALVDRVDEATALAISNEAPPKHFSAFEFPAIYEMSTRRLFYLSTTPMWGAAYINGFRNQVYRVLSY